MRRAPLLLALAGVLAFYLWTASSSGNPLNKVTPFQFKFEDRDYYNLQADALLHGQLSLRVPTDPALLAAANPYDPAVPASRLPDASFYDGRYYLSWGPAPAITLFAPAQLLGLEIRENLAVVIFALLGLGFGIALLRRLLITLVPAAPPVALWTGGALLALAGPLPWVLRRPTVYEVSLTAAFAFAMIGLLLVVTAATRDRMPVKLLAGGGVALGLAVLSRPTMGALALLACALVVLLRGEADRRALALVLLPVALAGLLFAGYNTARFSGPLDFGSKYQFGGRDARDLPYNDLGNLPPSLYGYLVAPPRLSIDVPFVKLPPPPSPPLDVPAGFIPEPTGSVLWLVPFVAFALAFGTLRVRRRKRDRRLLAVVGAAVVTATVLLVFGSFAVPGYTERYLLDLFPSLVIASTLLWAAWLVGARRPALVRRGGLALAVVSCVLGVLISFTGYYDDLRSRNPGVFEALETVGSPLSTTMAVVAGKPIVAHLDAPAGLTLPAAGYGTLGAGGASAKLGSTGVVATVVSPGNRTAKLQFTAKLGPDAQPVPEALVVEDDKGRRQALAVSDGVAGVIEVPLGRGVNRLKLYVSPEPAPGPFGPAASLELLGLRISG